MDPVTRLPDRALLAVFKQLPLRDQMIIRKVCLKWHALVPKATRGVHSLALLLGPGSIYRFEDVLYSCSFRTSKNMELLVHDDGTPIYPTRRLTEWNSLQFNSLDDEIVEQIASIFRNIKKLEVAITHGQASLLDYLVYLFEEWRHKLVTFRLVEDCDNEVWSDAQVDKFYEAINSLLVLKKLELFLLKLHHRDLPILSRLEEFVFISSKATPDQFLELLKQYAKGNPSLTRIEYQSSGHRDPYLGQFSSFSEHIRSCFTQLFFSFSCSDPAPICVNFRSLTRLFLSPYHMTFRHLFRHLAKLKQLLDLNLLIYMDTMHEDEQEGIPLPQVTSLKSLRVSPLRMRSHKELTEMNIPWTAPNVQVIEFNFDVDFKCTVCDVKALCRHIRQANLNNAKNCLCQIFRSLKADCSKLHTILHNHEEILGSAEELLAA